jgi:hypothetical protein
VINECIKENYLTFGVSKDIIDAVVTNTLKHALTNEQIRPRIRFVKVNSEIKSFD